MHILLMNQSLSGSPDSPYGQQQQLIIIQQQGPPQEHPAVNWIKLIFLLAGTYGLMVSMWFLW